MSSNRTFAIPQVHDVIFRSKLYDMLDNNMDKRLILVQGQAAQGKSTLIASYLSRHSATSKSSPVQPKNKFTIKSSGKTQKGITLKDTPIWLHLSQRESDHNNLFDLLVNAFTQMQTQLSKSVSFSHGNLNKDSWGSVRQITNNYSALPATLGTGEEITRHIDIVLSILSSIPNPVSIVFDNLESLDSNSTSFAIIQSIMNHICLTVLPPNRRLFLISRHLPPLNISKIKMEHNCLIINNKDLAFTLEETEEFFDTIYNNRVPSDIVKKIHAITEGWPGGLILISESLLKSKNIESILSLSVGTPDTESPIHLTSETLDYFSNEVYALLPQEVKKFLIRASMFDEIDEEIANNLCDTENAIEILSYLEKRNLFIQRLASKPSNNLSDPVCYRFNTLFKQFLFRSLLRKISSDELKALNNKAGQFFEKRGEIELSVRYYLEGEDYNMASDMIKKCATDLLVRGCFPNLSSWIESLPENVVKNDPWLIYYLTITRRIKGGVRNIEDFSTALKMFESNNDIRGCMLATAHLIEAGVFVHKSPTIIETWIKKGESLLLKMKDSPYFSWARALLWQHIAFGYIAGDIDINKGFSSCKNARILAKRVQNPKIEINASIVMVFGYVRAGNFSAAEELLRDIQPLIDEDIHPEYRALNFIIRIDFALKQGAFDAAEKYLQESENDVEKFGLIFLYPAFIELKALHRIYTYRFIEAATLADHLSDFSILSGNTFYLALAHHIKAMSLYHKGCIENINENRDLKSNSKNLQFDDSAKDNRNSEKFQNCTRFFYEAKIESDKALNLLHEQKGEDARLFLAKALNGLILMKQAMYHEALSLLTEAFDFFETVSSGILWCETKAALGLVFWKYLQHKHLQSEEKNRYISLSNNSSIDTNGVEYILEALKKAFQQGYERFSLISPSDFAEIVLIGIAFDNSNSFFNRLSPLIANCSQFYNISCDIKSSPEKARFIHFNPVAQIKSMLKHPLIAKEPDAFNRLKNLYRLTLPKVSIKTLGQFSVLINNQPIADNIWDGNKPKLLLKSIICHNTRDVPKEMIIDDIWPDASMKAGEKNFKINLHRLRKALEPDVNKQVGYSYITMDAGRLSLDSELVSVDIDSFTELVKEGFEQLAREEILLAISFFEQATIVYKGDFLPEESYETWIDLKRDSLRRDYIEMLMTLSRLYEEEEKPFQAVEYLKKAIQADPLHEEAYQNLMIVYADTGMISAATGLYEKWRQIAKNELGIEPAHETRNIYNKIKARYLKKS